MHIEDGDHNESDGVECPWNGCDNVSDTVRGMKIHHAHTHGESIAGELVKCDWCGDTRREKLTRARNQEHHFCRPEDGKRNSECQNKWQSDLWGNGPSPVPRDQVTVECSWCGDSKDVQRHVYEKNDHFFCSPSEEDNVHSDCYRKWLSENYTREGSPVWSGRITVNCAQCGAPKDIAPHRTKYRERYYCDRECHAEWMSEHNAGENSRFWKGGVETYYGANWPEQREKRIQHDDGQCVHCGMTRDEHYSVHGRDLNVHHITRKEDFRDDNGVLDYERANDLSNLLTLCDNHHKSYEGVPIDTRHIAADD